MSGSTVRISENNQVEIRRTFAAAFLLTAAKWGKAPMIRGFEPGQPVTEILPASEIGQKLIALGFVWQWRPFQQCPYCHERMGTAPSFRNYLQRSGFNPAAVLNECTACGEPLPAPVSLFEKVSPGNAASLSHAEGTA